MLDVSACNESSYIWVEGLRCIFRRCCFFSRTWEEHLIQIRALFDRFISASLTVNLLKCEFAKATVTYLGKVVGQGQVHPFHSKVEATEKYPTPTTKRDLMRFLEMVRFYCCFRKNFPMVAVTLTNLLWRGADF